MTRRQGKQSVIRLLVLATAIGVALKVFGPFWARAVFRPLSFETVPELVQCFIAVAVSLVLHEAGHLLAALLFRFHVIGGSLGPFRMTYLHGERSVQFSLQSLFAGSVVAIPPREANWKRSMLWVVAAGPIATLLLAVVASYVCFVGVTGPNQVFWTSLAQMNVLIFLLGLLPSDPMSTTPNDAALWSSILRDTPAALDIFLYHSVMRHRVAGFRPRFYPKPLIEEISRAGETPDLALFFAQTIAAWALDSGDLGSAIAWNARCAELIPISGARTQPQAVAHWVCVEFVAANAGAAVQSRLSHFDCALVFPRWLEERTRSIAALSEKQVSAALAHLCRTEYYLPSGYPCYEYERMLIASLRRSARELAAWEEHSRAVPSVA